MSSTIGNSPNPISFDPLLATLSGKMAVIAAGQALPTSNIGPIFHFDYMSIMTWQVFNANGANYTGYASIDVGKPSVDGQQDPRPGFLKRNGASISKTTYSALWNWALHTGCTTSVGTWTAGPFLFTDNGDGTFKVPDNRGEFERNWDDGRGVDPSRVFGSVQTDMLKAHKHIQGMGAGATEVSTPSNTGRYGNVNTGVSAYADYTSATSHTTGAYTSTEGGTETRPRNVALNPVIKF